MMNNISQASFPLEITENILSRLPIKSLLQYRCVSKTWCNLINSTHFINLHVTQSKQNTHVDRLIWNYARLCLFQSTQSSFHLHPTVIHQVQRASPTFPLDLQTTLKTCKIFGSFGGLLCMYHLDKGYFTISDIETRTYTKIPFDLGEYQRYVWRIHSDIFGFWYDGNTLDFMIVMLQFAVGGVVNVIVYSLGKNLWRQIHENIPYKGFDHDSSGIYVNGVIYWVASNVMDVSKKVILAFDCESYDINELPLRNSGKDHPCTSLTTFGQRLCDICYCGTSLDVWVMEERGWVHTFRVPKFDLGNPASTWECNLFFHGNEKEESISDTVYYEVFDIPLPELQVLKTLKVSFQHATNEEVAIHYITLPKQSTVGDLINDLKNKVELSHSNAELRLLEVFYHKIYKIFPTSEKIECINDQYWTLRAEEIPAEEENLGPHAHLIHVYHFTHDISNQMVLNFGEPFLFIIHDGETLAEIKVRIQKKLLVPDDEFSMWKFAFLSLGQPKYLQDTDILSTHFRRRYPYGAWEQYLGLQHL